MWEFPSQLMESDDFLSQQRKRRLVMDQYLADALGLDLELENVEVREALLFRPL